MRARSGLVLISLVVAACGPKVQEIPPIIDAPPQPRAVRFVAFGDAGTGSAEQIAIGQAMADVCKARKCDLALELGDNIYDTGVEGPEDPLFDKAFEIPYAPLTNLRIPIYVVLGNHDNSSAGVPDPEGLRLPGDGALNARGDHQVAYDKRADLPNSMWRMPARYYKFAFPPPQFSETPFAEFFALDSSPLAPYRDDADPKWNPESYGAAQQAWLSKGLEDSRARWKVVFAHHPYLSNGVHGNAGEYDEDLKKRDKSKDSKYTTGKYWKKFLDDTVCAQGVNLYLAAHDHDLQWLKPVEACGDTEFIVSGAAEGGIKKRAFGNPKRNEVRWQQDQAGGFFWVELTEDQMRVAAFTVAANGQLMRDGDQVPVPMFEKTLEHPERACEREDEPEEGLECEL